MNIDKCQEEINLCIKYCKLIKRGKKYGWIQDNKNNRLVKIIYHEEIKQKLNIILNLLNILK